MAATGTAKTTVWRWQERFMAEGVDGLLRDKTRPPGKPPVPDDRAARVVAKAAGLAVSTVQGIWKAHGCSETIWMRAARQSG